MVFWLLMLAGFLVFLLIMWRVARHVARIEDDSSYVAEESGGFTPYGQKFLDLLTFRR